MVELIKFVQKEHFNRNKIGEDISNLFKGELNPVALKAQRRVPIPEGLDLEAWINEPQSDSDQYSNSSSDTLSECISPTVNHKNDKSVIINGSLKKLKTKKEYKKTEAEIQLEIDKVIFKLLLQQYKKNFLE